MAPTALLAGSPGRNAVARRWPEWLRRAQQGVADRLQAASGPDGFDREAYLGWLAGEAAVAVLCADAMDELARWHASDAVLRWTAHAWAAELRELARLAACDLRAAGGDTPSLPSASMPPPSVAPPLIEAWAAFLAEATGSQRAGEALGAIALQARLLPGNADAALAALGAHPTTESASRYVSRRRNAEPEATRASRDRLLDAYSGAALAAGARRAATWALDALAATRTCAAAATPRRPRSTPPLGET